MFLQESGRKEVFAVAGEQVWETKWEKLRIILIIYHRKSERVWVK